MTDEERAALLAQKAAIAAARRSGLASLRTGETAVAYQDPDKLAKVEAEIDALLSGRTRGIKYGFQSGKGH